MKMDFDHIILIIFISLSAVQNGCSLDDHDLSKEEAEEVLEFDLVVAQDGSGDYESVQAALDASPKYRDSRTYIFIKKGIYKEKLEMEASKRNIALIGEDAEKTILTFDDYAQKINPGTGQEFGTSGSRSFYIGGTDFYAQDITFENSAGPVGQALAVYIQGDRAIFSNCSFLGFQDTMYGDKGRQYFKNCYIAGSTDFIFGPSTAVFDQCTIHSRTGNYITAASTPENNEYGYVFLNCHLTAEPNVQTYLGRPWRDFAKVVFLNCTMGDHIKPAGWHNWNKPEAEKTVLYAEYNSTGPGANPAQRVSWSKQLNGDQASKFSIDNVLQGTHKWDPVAIINEIHGSTIHR